MIYGYCEEKINVGQSMDINPILIIVKCSRFSCFLAPKLTKTYFLETLAVYINLTNRSLLLLLLLKFY